MRTFLQLDLLRVHDKKDDNAQVEQRNCGTFGTGLDTSDSITLRYLKPMNALTRRPYGQLTNYFHANLKLKNEAQKEGQIVRVHEEARCDGKNQAAVES